MKYRINTLLLIRLSCFIPAFYFIFSSAYALWQFREFGQSLPHFMRYIAVPSLFALGLIWAGMRLKNDLRLQIGLNVSAILLGAFAFEAYQQVQFVRAMRNVVAPVLREGVSAKDVFDGLPPSRTPKAINGKMEGLTSLSGALLSGIPNSDVFLCMEGGQAISYRADRFGYNNPDSVYDGRVDIAVFGDSFTEGYCLPPGKDFVSRLREIYPGSVSVGLRGSGPLFELAMFRRIAPIIKPSTAVIAFYEGNDWSNLEREIELPWLKQTLDPNADPGTYGLDTKTKARVSAIAKSFWESDSASHMLFIRTHFVRNFFALNETLNSLGLIYPAIPHEQPSFQRILNGFVTEGNKIDAEVKLLFIPQKTRYQGLFPKGYAADLLRRKVLAAATAAGIDVIDLAALFAEDRNPARFFAPNGHFSAEGAQFTAKALAERIRCCKERKKQLEEGKNG